MNLHEKAHALNADLASRRPDLEWRVVGSQLVLGHSKEWSDRYRAECAQRAEEERRRFNWRQMHPVTKQDAAA
ncbi:MAG: hypothetical protein AB7E24_23975 [Novosphingobium sp.]